MLNSHFKTVSINVHHQCTLCSLKLLGKWLTSTDPCQIYSNIPCLTYQICTVKDLNLSHCSAAWVSHKAVFIVDGQRTEALWVGRCVTYRMENFHVTDIVDVQALFQTYDQTLKIVIEVKPSTSGTPLLFQVVVQRFRYDFMHTLEGQHILLVKAAANEHIWVENFNHMSICCDTFFLIPSVV